MAAHAALVAAAAALAALPTAVELEEAAATRFALGGRHATTGGAGILVVNDLGVVVLQVAAWLLRAGGVDGGGPAEAVVDGDVNVPCAGREMVVMPVVVVAHGVGGGVGSREDGGVGWWNGLGGSLGPDLAWEYRVGLESFYSALVGWVSGRDQGFR